MSMYPADFDSLYLVKTI